MSEKLTQKVDPQKKGIQSGWVTDPPKKKDKSVSTEELDLKGQAERRVYQQILKSLIPSFPIAKLEKQSLADLKRFFEEMSPILQEAVLEQYKKISP